MQWYFPIYDWLIQAALLSLLVLLVGCAAVPFVRADTQALFRRWAELMRQRLDELREVERDPGQ